LIRDDTISSARSSARFADLVELTKPRINTMVLLTTLVGALMTGQVIERPLTLLAALVGTYLLAAAAAALNMVAEEHSDALMERTAGRPLPSGRVTRRRAMMLGVGLTALGTASLALWVNPLTTVVGLITLGSYLVVYTPLKRYTPWSTHIGAVPGALPPVMGWTAVTAHDGLAAWAPAALWSETVRIGLGPWALFAILFFWQLPHFFAIAWKYRLDYARGGLAMLSVEDEAGVRTSNQALAFTAALVVASVTPWLQGMAGTIYLAVALLLGGAFLVFALRFRLERNEARARALMLYSILYLPALLIALVAGRAG
jgi:protoheme IX farnesyltransferase